MNKINVSRILLKYLSTTTAVLFFLFTLLFISIQGELSLYDIVLLFLLIIPECVLSDYFINNRFSQSDIRFYLKLAPVIALVIYSSILFIELHIEINGIFYGLSLLLLALPFFASSINKSKIKTQIKYTVIGFIPILLSYIYLSYQTDQAYLGIIGVLCYFLHCFMLLFAVSSAGKEKFLSILLGFLNAGALYYIQIKKNNPIAIDAKWDWDWNLSFYFEVILVLNYFLCITIYLLSRFLENRRISRLKRNQNPTPILDKEPHM